MTPRLVAVVGPTATGKSDLALELALRLDGEIVNADAMQLYRGLDIGTAKLAPSQRRGVPHHQIDVLDVTETASVAAFQRHARTDVEALRSAGRTPVLVGGSGLYVQAVLDELEFPGTDPAVRARLEAELAAAGPHALHRRLAERDPAAAADVLASNGRRIVRALEVIELTGRPFRARLPDASVPRYDAVLLGVDRDVDALDERVAARVDRMLDDGLVAETLGLLPHGLREGRTASRALGYRQVLDALDAAGPGAAPPHAAGSGPATPHAAGPGAAAPHAAGPGAAARHAGGSGAAARHAGGSGAATPHAGGSGAAARHGGDEVDVARIRDETVRATRRFVRRQRSWFRRDRRIHWLDGADPDLVDRAMDRVTTVTGRR